jgi:hypothetical protein
LVPATVAAARTAATGAQTDGFKLALLVAAGIVAAAAVAVMTLQSIGAFIASWTATFGGTTSAQRILDVTPTGRASTLVQFPGGYIAEIHISTFTAIRCVLVGLRRVGLG